MKYHQFKLTDLQLPDINTFGSIYSVYPNSPDFPTIQSAINKAVSDGHTSNVNSPAIVLIYPKLNGGWIEDLTLKDGVNLVGAVPKNKDYSILITGQCTYAPASTSSLDTKVTISNLYLNAPSGKNAINLTGTNAGTILLRQLYIDKVGGTDSVILMNGNNSSIIDADTIDGNITSSASGCTIYDIQNGRFQSSSPCFIGSIYPGKILNCASAGVVNAQIASNCTGANAITIAAGGSVTLANSAITNNQANSNGASISSGGTLTALEVLWNIPAGTGKAVSGVAGSVWIYANNAFVSNKNYSTAIGAGAIALATTPVAS